MDSAMINTLHNTVTVLIFYYSNLFKSTHTMHDEFQKLSLQSLNTIIVYFYQVI